MHSEDRDVTLDTVNVVQFLEDDALVYFAIDDLSCLNTPKLIDFLLAHEISTRQLHVHVDVYTCMCLCNSCTLFIHFDMYAYTCQYLKASQVLL